MSGIDVIEAPLLKVPFEALKRAAKDRKSVVDEVDSELTAFTAAVSTVSSPLDHVNSIEQLVSKLQGLKRKLQDISKSEADDAQRCKARLKHLAELGPLQRERALEWNKPRLDRLIAEHLLRSGCPQSAIELVKNSNLEQVLDIHIYEGTFRIVAALRQGDCGLAIAWCDDNRAKLKKFKSKLEFDLRVQEFIELVRKDERMLAVQHARKHLAPWAGQHLVELQRVIATLAFSQNTKCPAYRYAEITGICVDDLWVILHRQHALVRHR